MLKIISTFLKTGPLLLLTAVLFVIGCQQAKPDLSLELKPIVDKYAEVWNKGNVDELDAIMESDYTYHSNKMPAVNGIDGLKKVLLSFRTAYPDLKLVLEDELFSENKASGRWHITGTNTGAGEIPPTGKSVDFWGIAILHISNGKLKEEWTAFDNQSLMEQLGLTMVPMKEEKKKLGGINYQINMSSIT
jgi:steroid delta-isomerase-like uncharacterized protein